MLTAKQIQGLPESGWFPNSYLRSKFKTKFLLRSGKSVKHGHVVPARSEGNEKKGIPPEDLEFIGNRSQYLWRLRNPLKPISERIKAKYQSNRLTKERGLWFKKLLSAFGKLLSLLNVK